MKGTCPTCLQEVRVTTRGRYHKHQVWSGDGERSTWCPASGTLVAPVVAPPPEPRRLVGTCEGCVDREGCQVLGRCMLDVEMVSQRIVIEGNVVVVVESKVFRLLGGS